MCVMVVMPALTKSQQSHPETVFGRIAGRKPLRPHIMGGTVYQPSGVQANDRAKEDAPQQVLPSTGNKNDHTQRGDRDPMPLAVASCECPGNLVSRQRAGVSRFGQTTSRPKPTM